MNSKPHQLFFVWMFILILMVLRLQGQERNRNEEEQNENEEVCVDNTTLKISHSLDLGNNKTAWVIDHSLPHCLFHNWFEVALHFDQVNGYMYNYLHKSKEDSIEFNKALWSRRISNKHLVKIPSWNKLMQAVGKLLNKKVKVIDSSVDLYQAMDPLQPFIPSDCSAKHYNLIIFINKMWNLNNYAQITFYDVAVNSTQSESKMWEIKETVHPHPFRAIVWPSCQAMLLRAPCVNYFEPFSALNVKLTVDMDESVSDQGKVPKESLEIWKQFAQFQFNSPKRNIDISKHLFKSFNDGNLKRQVNVFDGLFTPEELVQWRQLLLKFAPATSVYDAALLEDNDNVRRVRQFKVEKFVQNGMWPRLRALCEFVSNHSGWFPYDVAINHVRFSDHTRIHPDSERHQEELTMVLYLNEDLSATDYGETTFYVARPDDGVHGFIGEGGNLYEAIGTIAPKFGRIAIFTNNIEHSAHPPSSKYPGCRYTFALKVSKTRRLALIKMAYEGMEMLNLNAKMQNLKRKMVEGDLNKEESYPTSALEQLVKKVNKRKDADLAATRNQLEKF